MRAILALQTIGRMKEDKKGKHFQVVPVCKINDLLG
jgi:hypothetical protein